ncbi:DUF5819 family protein [Streptomyces sp. NPDC002520]
MDAYDEDSQAPPGPDGSTGVRRPELPEQAGARGRETSEQVGARRREASEQGGALLPEDPEHREGPVRRVFDDLDGPGGAPAAAYPSEPSPSSGQPPSSEPPPPAPSPRTGVAALSPRYQVVAAVALGLVAVTTCVHLAMVFLSVAPPNTVTKQHGKAVEEWVYPEFEQNWKLFAPNPLQQNIAVQARAQVRTKDGDLRTTGWVDLSAQDGAAIDGNLVPSHTQQNEVRRAWDFLAATHGADNRPVGMRGALSEQYVRRIVVMRLYRYDTTSRAGVIERVQVRSSTTNVQPPAWSREKISDKPVYRLLPWWTVSADEAAGGVR